MGFGKKPNGFVDSVSPLNHVERAGFGGESGIKFGIFAGQIQLAEDSGGRDLVLVGGWGRIFGVGKGGDENSDGGG